MSLLLSKKRLSQICNLGRCLEGRQLRLDQFWQKRLGRRGAPNGASGGVGAVASERCKRLHIQASVSCFLRKVSLMATRIV
jgi:hypothetical protein